MIDKLHIIEQATVFASIMCSHEIASDRCIAKYKMKTVKNKKKKQRKEANRPTWYTILQG